MVMRIHTSILVVVCIILVGVLCVQIALLLRPNETMNTLFSPEPTATVWSFQAVDTMKYSRDLAREKLRDATFDEFIDKQLSEIKKTGATHVAIATPYDEEFLPFLQRWVSYARTHNLKVWFRGNWAGWEEWFDYPSITRQEHIAKTEAFITKNPDLFEDGDVFSACPECENGGPGDPRMNGDAEGHKKFLIDEYQVAKRAFGQIGKNVAANFNSMNGDVARLIMDAETTRQLDGIVVVDHYVETGEVLEEDIKEYARNSGGKVVLGEFGAPIPDIHGDMSEQEQARWLADTMNRLSKLDELVGLSYWTSLGGSTSLWYEDLRPKEAVSVLTEYFNPNSIRGRVVGTLEEPISDATITGGIHTVRTDSNGEFILPILEDTTLMIDAPQYVVKSTEINQFEKRSLITIELERENPTLLYRLRHFLRVKLNLPV